MRCARQRPRTAPTAGRSWRPSPRATAAACGCRPSPRRSAARPRRRRCCGGSKPLAPISVEHELQEARARAKVEKHLALTGADPGDLTGARQQALVAFLADAGEPVRQAEALKATGASSSTVKGLAARGIVEVSDREVERTADAMDAPLAPVADVTLHPEQVAALGEIGAAIARGQGGTFLLHGVTGSGKTEVYLRALADTLARGESGIVLVPEIALTPQTVRRFRAHFGDRVAVLHSRMSPGERLDAWTRIRDGKYPVVIGPRSAIFAPVEDLGLVIVDEEHEASYKQFDPAPRYHARDVAVLPRAPGRRRLRPRQRHAQPGDGRERPLGQVRLPRDARARAGAEEGASSQQAGASGRDGDGLWRQR